MKPVAIAATTGDASLGACLCALLELDADETPGEAGAHRWQEFLAARNLRLTRAAELPSSGFWIGLRGDGHHVVMFGSPPDVVWEPAGPSPVPVAAGYVLGALDPALPSAPPEARPEIDPGVVEGIYLAGEREAPCEAVAAAEAVAGRGLRGDRYFHGRRIPSFGAP